MTIKKHIKKNKNKKIILILILFFLYFIIMRNFLNDDIEDISPPRYLLSNRDDLILNNMKHLPLIIILMILYTTENGLVTIIIYDIFLILVPLIHNNIIRKNNTSYILDGLFHKKIKQFMVGILGFFTFFIIPIAIYFFLCYQYNNYFLIFKFPIYNNSFIYIIFFILMGFFTPLLEEYFWRVFLFKYRKLCLNEQFIIHFNFGCLYLFIFNYILNFCNGIIYGGLFLITAVILNELKRKFGFLTIYLCRIGMNLAFCLIFILIINKIKLDHDIYT